VSEYVGAFLLGNAAILGNACMLPLYPGLIAFLAGNIENERVRHGGALLGTTVLAGVLATMLALGLILFTLGQSFSRILPWLLPVTYGLVILLGLALVLGRNPFTRLSTAHSPVLANPYASAFVYGGLLAPMTLPCTGPVVVSAFVLGVGSASTLGLSVLYFLIFGLGFGWPLVMLPLVASPLQRRLTRWFSGNSLMIGRLAGAMMVAIAAFGLWVEVVPTLRG
jgi:cytochrome c-type biogenesis protein